MKKFTRLLAVVLLFASYSCVQDTTTDLAPVISEGFEQGGEVKTLQVSLPTTTRTELGEKANGKYPVSWSEGDVLAVNGKPTTAIKIKEDAPNVAVFELPLGVTIPYNIVYPYPGEDADVDVKAGKCPVKFATEQQHTLGSFAQGSAPMYAWTDGFSNITMQHLTTVLKFSIKAKAGESVDLRYISVSTVEAEPIAGMFDVYCSEDGEQPQGTLVPRKSASSTVFYNFENNSHELTSNSQTFYIPVPKGSYTTFEVNFVEQSGKVCSRTFDASGDNELLGGKVREFPVVEFEANSNMLLIGSDANMTLLAKGIEDGSFYTKYDGALLVSNIDMTGKPWTSIENFKSVFEGRNYSIKGLTTPLFGENVVGTISNVKVEGNLVEENDGHVGLIARSLSVDGDKVGKIFNCATTGSIEYKNTTLAVNENLDLINVGGAVGCVYGGIVSLVDSDVNISITTAAGESAKSVAYTPCIGGVVGYACENGKVLPVITENESNGAIVWDDNSQSSKVTPYIGGVAGYVVAGTFADNVNSGALAIREAMYDLDWGGVIGASKVAVERCENKGSLEINEAIAMANIGGVVGKLEAGSVSGSVNSGAILLDEKFHISNSCNVGGVVAYAEKGTKSIENCNNSGSISYYGSCEYVKTNVKDNANMRLGGVIGFCWSESVSNCHNAESAVLNIFGDVASNGDVSSNKVGAESMTGIAGVIGSRCGKQADLGTAEKISTINCSNKGNVRFAFRHCSAAYVYNAACIGVYDSDIVESCKNDGNLLVEVSVAMNATEGAETTTNAVAFVSGLFGCFYSNCDHIKDCVNTGTITFDNAKAGYLYMSGLSSLIASNVKCVFDGCANTGDITIGENVEVTSLYAGGILATTLNTTITYDNCYNSGTIESKATAIDGTYLGSVFGRSVKANTETGATGIRNSGEVIYSGKSAIAYVGGYSGRYEEDIHSVEFTNTETGTVEFRGTASKAAYVGGVVGFAGNVRTNGTIVAVAAGPFRGMNNKGKVLLTGYAPTVYMGGVCGQFYANSGEISGLSNFGTIEMPDNVEQEIYPDNIFMGGLFGCANLSIAYSQYPTMQGSLIFNECNNAGDVLYKGIARDGAYVGGVAGASRAAAFNNCVNDGRIISTGHAGDAAPKLPSGSSTGQEAHQQTGWAFNFKNNDLAVGGIVGETDSNMDTCVNNGDVTHTCTLSPLKVDHEGNHSTSRFDVGGIAGRTMCSFDINTSTYELLLSGLINNAPVTIYGSPSATNTNASVGLSAGVPQWRDVDDGDRGDKRIFYRVTVAGLIGRLMDNSSANVKYTVSNCTNKGAVSVPEAGGAKNLNIAGCFGELLISAADFNTVTNEGRVSVEKAGVGTNTKDGVDMKCYYIHLAGIVASYFDCRNFAQKGNFLQTVNFNDCENSGDIHYGEIAASVYQTAGGIMARVMHSRGDWCVGNYVLFYPGTTTQLYTGSGERYSCLDIKFNRCKNSGNIDYLSSAMNLNEGYNYSYAGGILGTGHYGHNSLTQQYNSLDLTFDHCENSGSIQFDRCNGLMATNANVLYSAVGGIVGHHTGGIGVITTNTSYTSNARPVSTRDAFSSKIISCKNSGRIWGYTGQIGGIIGRGNWYVKITGTEDDPTINTGDIVVLREGGKIVTKNRYGNKYIYAGGIAGYMCEFVSTAYTGARSPGDGQKTPPYRPENQFARIEYAVNEGAVGSTGHAGGIAGYYWSAVEPSKSLAAEGKGNGEEHRGGLEFCRNTGEIYALEGATTSVGAIVGMSRMFIYTDSTDGDQDMRSFLYGEGETYWPIGVNNCYVGGKILRGSVGNLEVNETNFMQAIYGETWAEEYVSTSAEKPYDGCEFYVPRSEAAPGEGDQNNGENNGEGGSEGGENGEGGSEGGEEA